VNVEKKLQQKGKIVKPDFTVNYKERKASAIDLKEGNCFHDSEAERCIS